MRSGGAMFGSQVGQALGGLAGEVLTASDIGLPLGPEGKAALRRAAEEAKGQETGAEDWYELACELELTDVDEAMLDFGVQGIPGGVQAPATAHALLLEGRRALEEGSMIVNSSRGGGAKDTWVLQKNE